MEPQGKHMVNADLLGWLSSSCGAWGVCRAVVASILYACMQVTPSSAARLLRQRATHDESYIAVSCTYRAHHELESAMIIVIV